MGHPFSFDRTARIFQELNVERPRYPTDNRVLSFGKIGSVSVEPVGS